MDIDKYLFSIGHPEKILVPQTPKSKHELILKYFYGGIRHSISHSNIILLKGEKEPNIFSVVLRHSSDEKNSAYQEYFESFIDFVKKVEKNISILYNSMRFFGAMTTGYIQGLYEDLFSEYIESVVNIDHIKRRMMKDGPLF